MPERSPDDSAARRPQSGSGSVGGRQAAVLRLVAVLSALVILALTTPSGLPRDFCTYYSAGSLANDAGPAAAFDLERLNRRHEGIHPGSGRRVGSFYYSPIFLAPASLLARLDFEAARVLNQVLILIALGGIFYLVLEPARPKWLTAMLFFALVAGDPIRVQFIYQNWTAILVLLIALALRQTTGGHDRSAVVLWALAFHLKLYAALFVVPLFLIGKRRLALSSLALFVLLLALPLPWTGIDAPLAYLGSLTQEAGSGFTVFYNQISVPAALARFARTPVDWVSSNRPVESLALQALVWLSLAGFIWAAWTLGRQAARAAETGPGKIAAPSENPTVRALALTIPYLLLFVPKMWDHGELLFLTLFVLAALPRRLEAFAAGYLILSLSYFPLVQLLLEQTLRGEIAAIQFQALALFYPLLNLLAAAALLGGVRAPSGAGGSARST